VSTAPQPTPAGKPDARRSLLTILGGLSLAFCSYVAFFSFPGQGVVESVASVTYGALFVTGVILFAGGCVQAIGVVSRKLKGGP